MASSHRILVINIGSTTTKVAFFENHHLKSQQTIDHVSQQIESITDYMEQFALRKEAIEGCVAKHHIELSKCHMIVSRGGLTAPLSSGVYLVDEGMREDLRSGKYGQHPTNLGPLIAHDLAKQASIRAAIVNSPSIDEYQPLVRVSGIPEIERQ